MPKKATELTAVAVKHLKKPGLYAVGGVVGLYLQVRERGARSWILRARIGDKRCDMGLGGFPDVSLIIARDKARQARALIEQGINPILMKRETKNALTAARKKEITFRKAAEEFMASKGAEWKNAKHRQQWTNTLSVYAYPVIGNLQVKDIDLSHVTKILDPIWKEKTETAMRLRGRVEAILSWATVRKYREGENPARWKGHLDTLLPAPGKITKTVHHRALPVNKLGKFMQELSKREGVSARALEFLILTAARSGEVRGATWDEIDIETGIWTIPAARMKAGREHRVPLCSRAINVLSTLPRFEGVDFVFPSFRKKRPLSEMSLTAITRRMNIDAVPHGFRSTFRDWAAEYTSYPREVAEMALAHTIENKVEAAYRRGNLFEKRALMMKDWESFCAVVQDETITKVVAGK